MVQLAAPISAAEGAASISSRSLWLTVHDGRVERSPRAVGVARMTMGIPREILQEGEWSVARALGHGLGTGLEAAGWTTKGFDPPDPRLAIDPASGGRPAAELPGWTLRLTLDRLWCDGYFKEFTLAVGLRLHLLDPSGRLRARAERFEDLVLPYKHSGDLALQVGGQIRLTLSEMLREIELGEHVGEVVDSIGKLRGRLKDEDYFYNKYEKAGPGDGDDDDDDDDAEPKRVCLSCQRVAEPSWAHCASCGQALPQ